MFEYLRKYRTIIVIGMHSIIIACAYYLSFLLRFEFALEPFYNRIFVRTLPIIFVTKILVFYYFGLFQASMRYVSTLDLWQVVKANAVATVSVTLAIVFLRGLTSFPRSIFILDWMICLGMLSGMRLIGKMLLIERAKPQEGKKTKHTLIIGAGAAGILALRELKNNPHINFNVVGFIDDDPAKNKLRIHGVRVLGPRQKIPDLIEHHDIEEIIIAIPSAKGETIRDIIAYCSHAGTNIKIVPGLYKILGGELEVKVRQVQPEDLLGRETVRIDEAQVRSYLAAKRVLITGAAGSIGSELCRQIASFHPHELILIDYNENDMYFLQAELSKTYPMLTLKPVIGDVRDVSILKHVFSANRPQVIFHAAAFKHVPLMEDNPSQAVNNNIIATRNLIYASEHYGVERFVFISTDKAVNPTSIMGATKRIGEMLLQAKAHQSKTKFMAVRFGNVLGSKGSVVPLFKKQIEEGGPVTVTHPDARRFFMSTKEAVQLVLQAAALGQGGELFILDMGEQIKIVDLARDLISLSGFRPEKEIEIRFIGLRPGEKLYEETLFKKERDQITRHNKIYITQPDMFDNWKLQRDVKELERLANRMAEDEVKQKIKAILSSYHLSVDDSYQKA